MPETMMRQAPQKVIRDPELNTLMRSKKEALNAYVANAQQYGEEDARTQSKLVLYVLRSKLCAIKETIMGYKEVMMDFASISGEIDSLLDMSFNVSAQQFSHGVEGFPKFLRKYIVRRRAKKYYKKKMARLESMIESTSIGIEAVGGFMSIVLGSLVGLTDATTNLLSGGKGKKKKGKDSFIDDEMRAEIERARASMYPDTASAGDADSAVGATGGATSDGDAGAGGGVMNW